MTDNTNSCACPNIKCKRHGNCDECRKSHKNKTMYCALKDGSLRKRLINRIFRAKGEQA